MALAARLFPPDHPYHWMTIGAADDIRAMQLEDVQAFFRSYYHPANASLVLAGDIDTGRAFDLAGHYFREIAPGTRPAPVRAEASLAREHRLLLEDRVEMPRLYMAWLSPAMFAPGDAEMDLLADALASGKVSRLYRTLVYDRRMALDVSAFQNSRELTGFFLLVATGTPGRSLADLAAAIDHEVNELATTGPTQAEMERAVAQAEAHFLYRLQTVGGFGGKSDQLNAYNVLRGDPGFFASDLERYRSATQESVQAAASRHLAFDRRVLLSVVPRGQQALALPGSEPVAVS
jgi:zinc protease